MYQRCCTSIIKDILQTRSLSFLLVRKNLIGSCTCTYEKKDLALQQTRHLSDSAFNLSDIIKANAKHKPGKTIGTSSKKQLNKTSAVKAKKSSTEKENNKASSSKVKEANSPEKLRKTNTSKAKKTEKDNDMNKEGEVTKKKTSSRVKKEKYESLEADIFEADNEQTKEASLLGPVPEQLKTVLEIPLILDKESDTNILAGFKELIEDLELKYLPSVSRIISATQPPEQVKVLERWKANKIKELGGEEQFNQYKKDLLNNGLNLHECIYNQLSGYPDATPLRQGNEGHWESIAKILPDVNEVALMEKECLHPELFYKGKFDCIAKYRGTLCLIEWKTASKPKPLLRDTYDNPLQIAAYLGAINRSNMLKKQGVEHLTSGAIVIAYADGEPATVHPMNQKQCERYWKLWVKRLYTYWVAQYDKKKVEE